MTQTRYAIYWAPSPGPLAEFTARWLGWDPHAGRAPQAAGDLPGLPRPQADLTDDPRKYGFHGTIKAPFRLSLGRDGDDLAEAVAACCARLDPVSLTGLTLGADGGFVALRPRAPSPALRELAQSVVEALDAFRAPLTEAEIARRRPERLTPGQRDNLVQWGYPYIGDDFHFHLTLTGPVTTDEGRAVIEVLEPRLTPLLPTPFVIDRLHLFAQRGSGPFVAIGSWSLAGG